MRPGTARIREMDNGVPRSQGHPQMSVSICTTSYTNTHVHYIPTIMHNTHANGAVYTHGLLNGHRISELLDTGASCSVIVKPHVHYVQIKLM